MPREAIVYRGWVGGRAADRTELEEIGVSVGDWNSDAMTFDSVSMTADVYYRFCEKWRGRFVWGLIGKRETVYSRQEIAVLDEDIPF